MSQPPLPPSNDGAKGLGHSTPIVTRPSAPSVFAMPPPPPPPPPQQQPLSVAATDHPLSAMNVDHQPSPPYQSMSPSGAGMGVAATASAQLGSSPSALPTAKKNTMNEAPFLSTTPTPVMSKPVPKIVSAPLSPTQSLDTLADSFFEGSASRPAPLPLTQTDLERVRILVERRAWGDVLSMTANLLRGSSSHYTPIYAALLNSPDKSFPSLDSHQNELVELIMLQCHAWIKMRRYNELALEISRWSFCHHLDDDDGKKKAAPSWIPWSLHILAAASLQYTEMKNKEAATDALWKIRTMIMSSGSPDNDSSGSNSSSSRPLDILCVEHALCNAFVRKKEWRMALECLDRIIRHLPEATKLEVEKSSSSNEDAGNKENAAAVLKTAYQCECYSRQGRILLQVGALEEASEIFQRATLVWKQSTSSSSSSSIIIPALVAKHPAIEQVPAQLQANDGLLSFAYNKYDGALESFRNAVNLMKQSDTSTLIVDGTYRTQDWIGPGMMAPERKQSLYSECMNDMALTALYTCRLHDSIAVMESLVREDPTAFLTERIALNLCTLYELSADTSVATRKKQLLQLIAKRFFLHDIGPESFRIGGG